MDPPPPSTAHTPSIGVGDRLLWFATQYVNPHAAASTATTVAPRTAADRPDESESSSTARTSLRA